MPHYADFQNEVYLRGLTGTRPLLPFAPDALERVGAAAMTPEALGYVAGGAGAERTLAANRAAFDRWRLVPRMLRGVTGRDLSTTLLGQRMPAPLLLAPVGVLSIVHPEADRAVARAAADLDLTMVLSSAASTTIEDVAAAAQGPRWFQLYWPADREIAASFVRRAERAGYTAVVVTVDTWQLGWRPRDLDQGYLPFLTGQGVANYFSDPVFRAGLAQPPEQDPQAAILHWVANFSNPGLTFDDLAFLRDHCDLPLVVKGILHPDDARRCAEVGVDAVTVSNHGGRQVDGAVGALDALPGVVAALDGALPVLFDSGVRTGSDVVKALALGAAAVLVGRPWVYGLAAAGRDGVTAVLRGLLADLDLALALSGHRDLTSLTSADLVAAPAGG